MIYLPSLAVSVHPRACWRVSAAFADRRDTIFSNFICFSNDLPGVRERTWRYPCIRCSSFFSGFILLSRFFLFFSFSIRVSCERDSPGVIAIQSDAPGFCLTITGNYSSICEARCSISKGENRRLQELLLRGGGNTYAWIKLTLLKVFKRYIFIFFTYFVFFKIFFYKRTYAIYLYLFV